MELAPATIAKDILSIPPMTSHVHPPACPLPPSGGALAPEVLWRCDSQCLKHLRQDLLNHQTVLTLASEALAQQPTSDRRLQQRLHRMQIAIAESQQLLETLLQSKSS